MDIIETARLQIRPDCHLGYHYSPYLPSVRPSNTHEKDLWYEFRKDMDTRNFSHWLYNGFQSKERPGDLGSLIGYRISQAYYNQALDKPQAIHDILNIQDVKQFLQVSQYGKASE
jgi:hypothetical protein